MLLLLLLLLMLLLLLLQATFLWLLQIELVATAVEEKSFLSILPLCYVPGKSKSLPGKPLAAIRCRSSPFSDSLSL